MFFATPAERRRAERQLADETFIGIQPSGMACMSSGALSEEMYGSREPAFFETPKLMVRDITGTHRLELTLDETKLYCDHTILCAIRACDAARFREMSEEAVEKSEEFTRELLQGLLASRLVSAYYYWNLTGEGVRTGGGFHTYPKTIRALPVFDITNASDQEQEKCREIGKLARRLLSLRGETDDAKTDHGKLLLSRQIASTDAQIDRIVCELYGMNDIEIGLVDLAVDKPIKAASSTSRNFIGRPSAVLPRPPGKRTQRKSDETKTEKRKKARRRPDTPGQKRIFD